MQGATAGAVYGEVTFRTRIPESVRREVRKCRNNLISPTHAFRRTTARISLCY